MFFFFFFFSSRRRHTRWPRDWSSDVCSSDLTQSLIDLIFETSHGLYRVLRTPEYFRPRQRRSASGSDTLVKEQAKALLWRLGSPDLITEALEDTAGQGAGLTPIASRLDAVGREIARAVGLSRAQVTQTDRKSVVEGEGRGR